MKNKMGPRIDPWGTPHVSGAEEETDYLRFTEKLLQTDKTRTRLEQSL